LQKSFGEHFLIEVKTLYKISCFVQTWVVACRNGTR
jgi:hypothetical protein